MAGRTNSRASNKRQTEKQAAMVEAYAVATGNDGLDPDAPVTRAAGLKTLRRKARTDYATAAILADPVVQAEIEMFEDPKGAERSGLVGRMIAEGHHVPSGSTTNGEIIVADEPTKLTSRRKFRKAEGQRPEMYVQIQTWKAHADTARIYDALKRIAERRGRGSIITHEQLVDAETSDGRPSDKKIKVLGISVELNNGEIADLRRKGAKVLEANMEPAKVQISTDPSDKGRHLARKGAAAADFKADFK